MSNPTKAAGSTLSELKAMGVLMRNRQVMFTRSHSGCWARID